MENQKPQKQKDRLTPSVKTENDPLDRFIEWQNHRYDPGHYLGGNIHPVLQGRRPNKYGYVLIVLGIGWLASVLLGRMKSDLPLVQGLLMLAFAWLVIIVGYKLVRGTTSKTPRRIPKFKKLNKR